MIGYEGPTDSENSREMAEVVVTTTNSELINAAKAATDFAVTSEVEHHLIA